MLNDLRQEISHLILDRKSPISRKISRTFFVLESTSLFHLKDWFQKWFPITDANISRFYPWLLVNENGDAFRIEVENTISRAFDADLAYEATMQGYSILDSVNQVLIVADLCEENALNNVVNGCETIANSLRKIGDSRIPVYWTGIFMVRRPEACDVVVSDIASYEIDEKKVTEIISADKKTIDRISKDLSQDFFHRIFFLDISNPQGTFLPKRKDQDCLIGHLLYFLSSRPSSVESPDQYTEWLQGTQASEGFVSGFSAFSFVLPIDQILETISVSKGAEILNESLLKEKSPDSYLFYLNNFLQENSIIQFDEVRKVVTEKSALKDPITNFPDFYSMRSKDFLETVDTLDASLPRIAKDNAKTIEKISKKHLREWKKSLENHIESIIIQELGGLQIAKKFLSELHKHIEKITPHEEIVPSHYDDPTKCLSKIRTLIDRGPRKEAIFGRALTLALIFDIAIVSFPLAILMKILLLICLSGFSLGLAFFYSYTAKQQLQNQIFRLESLLRGKWKALMDFETLKAAKKHLEKLNKIIEQMQNDVGLSVERLKGLVEYFRNEYTSSFPEEFPFWKYIVKERKDLLWYQNLCSADISYLAVDYIKKDRPMFLWRRLSPPKTSEPNRWEWHLLEKAAIHLLPSCGQIINLHIHSFFQTGTAQFERNKMAMIRAAQPFLNLEPERSGSENPELNAMLETDPKERKPMIEELIAGLSGHFQNNVQRIGERSPYRLTFFSFLENSKNDDILLK